MDCNLQFGAGKQLRKMTIEPFNMVDGREVELGVLLKSQIVGTFSFCKNEILTRDASSGGRHIDGGKKEAEGNKLCNSLNCNCPYGHVTQE